MPRSDLPRLSLSQRLLGLLVLVLLLIALGFAVSQRLAERLDPEPSQAAPPPTVQVQHVAMEPFVELRAYRGSVEAETQTTVSARISATVLEIPYREGTTVEPGQVLVRLDDEELRKELERLNAIASRLEGELSLARREQARQEDLYQRQHTPEHLLDEARQRVKSLTAQLRENQATIALARIRLSYTEERAPFAGIISRVNVHEGELATAGRALIELVAIDRMKAVLSVPQSDAAMLAQGQSVELEVGALDKRWQGTVDRLYPTLDPTTRNTAIAVFFPISANGLRPGMTVHGHVELARYPKAVRVPVHAVYHDAQHSWVFLLEDGEAHRRQVETGQSRGGLVHVLKGLEEGELLITTADPRLVDGLKVVVRDSPNSGGRP